MRKSLLIYGAGGHGKVVLDAALSAGWEVPCVVDDAPTEDQLLGVKVLHAGDIDWHAMRGSHLIIGVGVNGVRARLYLRLVTLGMTPATLCHPASIISPHCVLGHGAFVAAGAVVSAGAVLGDNVIVNTSAVVDHDCQIGAHIHICPGVRLAGEVKVGDYTMIGTGACILPGVQVGAHCIIGAGAVVHRDVPDFRMVVGVPARVIKHLEVE